VEFSSFVVWELIHKLRLFRENKYISFNNIEALSIERGWIDDLNFIENANIFFNNRKLRIIKDYHAWKILFIDSFGNIWGCLFSNDNILYKSIDKGKSIILIKKFQRRIESIFITSQDTLFICVKGAVYRSIDRGRSFEKSLNFSSSESYFIFNNGMTETQEKTLIIGEYGDIWNKNHWKALAYLYYSTDNGGSWEKSDFLIKKGINKHVHLVRYSKLLNKILLTDGDNKKKLWISNLLKPDEKNLKWKLVNRFHIQTGGHTSVVESEKKYFLVQII